MARVAKHLISLYVQ